MKKLLLLAGAQRFPGYRTLDEDPHYGTDFVARIPPLPPLVRTTFWEEIALFHGIEHFYYWEAKKLLNQIYDCLCVGGTLVLEQPNIRVAAEVLTEMREPFTSTPGQSDMWPLYGDPTHENPLYCHKWGYTPESLAALLVLTGFKPNRITLKEAQSHIPGRDFRIEALR
jgi:hypothetical protein